MKNEVFQGGGNQGGRVKGHEAHLPHKHIKNTSNGKQFSLKTNWQKDS